MALDANDISGNPIIAGTGSPDAPGILFASRVKLGDAFWGPSSSGDDPSGTAQLIDNTGKVVASADAAETATFPIDMGNLGWVNGLQVVFSAQPVHPSGTIRIRTSKL